VKVDGSAEREVRGHVESVEAQVLIIIVVVAGRADVPVPIPIDETLVIGLGALLLEEIPVASDRS
jgi:hypothetical protein